MNGEAIDAVKVYLVEEVKVIVGREESTSKEEIVAYVGLACEKRRERRTLPSLSPGPQVIATHNTGHAQAQPGPMSQWWRCNGLITVAQSAY